MKAPDKIYVCIPQRLSLSTFHEDSKYVGMAYTDKGNLTSPQTEEYIRKDALLEWVKKEREFIEGLFSEGDASFYGGQDDAYNNLIAKLQSL